MSTESTTTESATTESPVMSDFQAQLESLEIPPTIDPKLLALWLERERDAIENQEKSKKLKSKSKSKYQHRKLNRLFAAYIGIIVFCLTIILGFIQQKETIEILNNACLSFLAYTVIGFFVGCVAEYCVSDSVETLLREIIRRSNEAAADAAKPEMETSGQES
jgi:hypothetical protein